MGRHSFTGPDESDEPEEPAGAWFGDPGSQEPDIDSWEGIYHPGHPDQPEYPDHVDDPDGHADAGDQRDRAGRAGPGGYAGAAAEFASRLRRRTLANWNRGRRRLEAWRRDRDAGHWRGGHRRADSRRGVSAGVVTALVAVIVVVGAVILWRFFGDSLSHRSGAAAARCVSGNLSVAVVADPTIADHLQEFADRFNKAAKPVGDRCVSVHVKPADAGAVVGGFIGDWPAALGERPALWVPGSSVSVARLTATAGPQTVSDSRSLVSSPVLLATSPKLASALAKQTWATLPGLQSTPDSLLELDLLGWGSLRLALPIDGNADAAFLAGEAVDAESAPHGDPPSAGVSALRTLIGAQPKLADSSLAEAMNTLLRPGDPSRSPVHAVVTTEQQLFTRATSIDDPAASLASWLPPGPVPVADYPAALLAGSWLTQEQLEAASEFARFARKPDQLAELAKAGFRVPDVKPPASEVTDFAPLPTTLSVGDEALRATLADALGTSGAASTVTIMLDRSMTASEGGDTRFGNVVAALRHRLLELPPNASVGLWTFDGTEGRSVVTTGPLADQLDGTSREETLVGQLTGLHSASGGAVSFTTLPMVYDAALAGYQAGQSNSVLVITAGPHTDRSLDSTGLQNFIRRSVDPQRPVAVNVIDFGIDPDQSTWQAVAKLSGGSYQNLASSASPELATALASLLS